MFITIKLRKAVKALPAIAMAVLAAGVLFLIFGNESAPALRQGAAAYTLVVDSGHGGVDGGAVSADGIKESDINAAVTERMLALADFLGLSCVSTTENGTNADDAEGYSEHDNLVARAEAVNKTENAVLISVHQNKFPNEIPFGAEAMYADTEGSRELGLLTQDNLVSQLDPSNRRVARPAPGDLLLTSSVSCPAVLVECGFMSNQTEAQKLNTPAYQLRIAAVLIGSYIQFTQMQTSV